MSAPDDLYERYEEIIGVTYLDNSPLQEITFWVSDNSKNYVITKPIHGSQKTIRGEIDSQLRSTYPSLKDGQFFQIECRENYELIRELTSFGPELVVLSPAKLKHNIQSQLKSSLLQYKLI